MKKKYYYPVYPPKHERNWYGKKFNKSFNPYRKRKKHSSVYGSYHTLWLMRQPLPF